MDWYLRGGFKRLLVWDPATGTTVDTTMVRAGADLATSKDTSVRTDGTARMVSLSRELIAGVSDWPALQQLRTWQNAGTPVRALLIALGRGVHRQWDESVVPIVEPLPAPFGSLSGDVLRMYSSAVDADVYDSPDLLEPFAGAAWDGTEDRVLPAPGLKVYGKDASGSDNVTLTALSFAAASLGSAGPSASPSLTLPANTYAVRVACATRPELATRPL